MSRGRPNSDQIGIAYDIAADFERRGLTGPDAGKILSMALGIYCEGLEDGHREMRPLVEAMLKSAQIVFDGLREGRHRKAARV